MKYAISLRTLFVSPYLRYSLTRFRAFLTQIKCSLLFPYPDPKPFHLTSCVVYLFVPIAEALQWVTAGLCVVIVALIAVFYLSHFRYSWSSQIFECLLTRDYGLRSSHIVTTSCLLQHFADFLRISRNSCIITCLQRLYSTLTPQSNYTHSTLTHYDTCRHYSCLRTPGKWLVTKPSAS